MEKEFVTYEIALKLKELGFDETCLANYLSTKKLDISLWRHGFDIPAPLYQQAFRWFREKYNLVSYVREATKSKYRFCIEKFDEKFYNSTILTYEEAELECLKKLIEIVKEK